MQPDCGRSHFYLGVANSQLARHEEAIRNYEHAIRHGWTEAVVYSNLGWSYFLRGEHKKALSSLQIARGLAPTDVQILNNLGVVNARLAQYDEAIKSLKRALFLRPELVMSRYNLGCVYVAQNDSNTGVGATQDSQYSGTRTGSESLRKNSSGFLGSLQLRLHISSIIFEYERSRTCFLKHLMRKSSLNFIVEVMSTTILLTLVCSSICLTVPVKAKARSAHSTNSNFS
jgi:Flp pilus assembly protein TadD